MGWGVGGGQEDEAQLYSSPFSQVPVSSWAETDSKNVMIKYTNCYCLSYEY